MIHKEQGNSTTGGKMENGLSSLVAGRLFTPPADGASDMSSEPRKVLARLLAVNEAWRTLNSEIQAQTVAAFYAIASRPGLTQTKLGESLGLAQSSVSRNVYYLSDWYKPGEKGLGLVRSEENPTNRREKIMTLTPKGERFLKQLVDILE